MIVIKDTKLYTSIGGNNPEKKASQNKLSNVLRDERLVKITNCEVCGKDKTEGHHYSYEEDKQLDVIWLCKGCHEAEHELINKYGYKNEKGLYLEE